MHGPLPAQPEPEPVNKQTYLCTSPCSLSKCAESLQFSLLPMRDVTRYIQPPQGSQKEGSLQPDIERASVSGVPLTTSG